jgi:UDP-N-acetylglucosamine--N-acetylmuramyl-(pentapeptide) pyrophosphoryl-undecaprenol N-acetylglucosamine transferase
MDLFRVPVGVVQAFFKLLRLRPKAVFSKGGYVAFPVVFAAWLLGIPVYIHESDAMPGLTTRLCAPFAKKIFLGFEEAAEALDRYTSKLEVVGNPIRLDLYEGKATRGKKWTGFSGKKPVLLIMGGSSGSHELNQKVEAEKKALLEQYDIVHITGDGKAKSVRQKNYIAVPYVGEEIKDLYALASLALTRAGAGALAELEALQVPALLFPLGLHASRGDQIANATALCNRSDLCRILEPNKTLLPQLMLLPARPTKMIESGTTQKIALTLLSLPART